MAELKQYRKVSEVIQDQKIAYCFRIFFRQFNLKNCRLHSRHQIELFTCADPAQVVSFLSSESSRLVYYTDHGILSAPPPLLKVWREIRTDINRTV